MIIAVDPGVHVCGYAFFEKGRLVKAGLVQDVPNGFRALPRARFCVMELMQAYPKCRANPNDLVRVAVVSGLVVGLYPAYAFVLPHEWKGSVPKKIHQQRILTKLSVDEHTLVANITPKSLRHNSIDAVGLGLYYLEKTYGRRNP